MFNRQALLHVQRRPMSITDRDTIKYVRSCLADHDGDLEQKDPISSEGFYVPVSGENHWSRVQLTTRGSAELMRRINLEANYDEQIAMLTNHNMANRDQMTERYNSRICGTARADGDGIFFLKIARSVQGYGSDQNAQDTNPTVVNAKNDNNKDADDDYYGSVREVLRYIKENCRRPRSTDLHMTNAEISGWIEKLKGAGLFSLNGDAREKSMRKNEPPLANAPKPRGSAS